MPAAPDLPATTTYTVAVRTLCDFSARQGDLVQVLDGVDGQTRLVHSGAGFLIDGDALLFRQQGIARGHFENTVKELQSLIQEHTNV